MSGTGEPAFAMWNRLIIAAVLVIAAGSPAISAEVTGRIRSLNQLAHTMTLDNGDTFALGSINAAGLHLGEVVKVSYRGIGAGKVATAVKPTD
jgi:hypothetical protein